MDLNGLLTDLTASREFTGTLDSSSLRRAVWSRDASHFRIVPEGTAKAHSYEDLSEILRVAHTRRTPVTFRSGGSSLSGQTLGSGLVVDVRSGFQKIVSIDSDEVTVEPGVTISRLNGHLLRQQRKIGPDPASMVVSTIGGAVANNSSGMSCGVNKNSYATILGATIVLSDGTVIDTREPHADEILQAKRGDIADGLRSIRDYLRSDEGLAAEIRRQFALKNTMGYSVQAFLDYDSPADILLHLMVGSQGTLGFLGDITLRTLPVMPHLATSVLQFDSLKTAAALIPQVLAANPGAIELLDATSLKALASEGILPPSLQQSAESSSVVFLVDFEEENVDALTNATQSLSKEFSSNIIVDHATGDERAELWKARKSVYAVVAKNRPAGTTSLLEDVVVHPSVLAQAYEELSSLCLHHGYDEPVFFGHVRDGNLHFMVCDDFSEASGRERLEAFTEGMVEIILKLGGNLKAEHGSGRAMAPFVEKQFGPELFAVMQQIKALLDPHGVLNPGVIFATHSRSHLDNVKSFPPAHDIVDSCVECGFCESQCPSAGLTLTPRERIVALREADTALLRGASSLSADERYEIDQTCAVDGMCALNCPVGINTGSLVKDLRAKNQSPAPRRGSLFAEKSWSTILLAGRTALKLASLLPRTARLVSQSARAVFPRGSFPLYTPGTPSHGFARKTIERDGGDIVFLPSCMNSLFGETELSRFLDIAEDQGFPLRVPPGVDSFCCGTPFSSKGFEAATEHRNDRTATFLNSLDAQAVVIDGSSCHQTLSGQTTVPTLDIGEFIARYLLDTPVTHRLDRIILHPTCSGEKTGANTWMGEISHRIAREVIVPVDWKCCGFAGDRGLLVPELTAHATSAESAELRGMEGVRVSNNHPCQIALTQSTGEPYRSIVAAWLEAVR